MRLEKRISALMRTLLHLEGEWNGAVFSELKAAQSMPLAQQAPTIVREASTASPKPSFTAHSYLSPDCSVKGTIHFEGPARIDGHVDGEISAKDLIVIGKSAVVTAKIHAESVILAGTVSGEITAGQRIEIRPSAEMQGSVTTPRLIIDDGASIAVHCATQAQNAALESQGQRACSTDPSSLFEILGICGQDEAA